MLLAPTAPGQCAQWAAGEGLPGVDGLVQTLTLWDPDGGGPAQPVVVLGGSSTWLATSSPTTSPPTTPAPVFGAVSVAARAEW